MTDLRTAMKVVKDHIGAEVSSEDGKLVIEKKLNINELAAFRNRVDYRYIDASKEGVTKVAL